MDPWLLLVHDNTWPCVARVCRQLPEDKGIDIIDWPPHSPDINPIEQLWHIMFQSITTRLHIRLSRSSLMAWFRCGRRSSRTLSVVALDALTLSDMHTNSRGHTNYWASFWVTPVKFQQKGLSLYHFSIWLSEYHWIQPSVVWDPLKSDVFSKCFLHSFWAVHKIISHLYYLKPCYFIYSVEEHSVTMRRWYTEQLICMPPLKPKQPKHIRAKARFFPGNLLQPSVDISTRSH